jgi:hypothetical protein
VQDAPAALSGPLAQINQKEAIDLVQAQIAGLKKEIADLTGQLVPGTSDARESAIENQMESATERLQSLQSQLDRMVSGEPAEPMIIETGGDGGDIPPGVMNVIEMGAFSLVFIVLGLPLVRMIARRLEPRPKADPTQDNPRLERLEQAVDAIAIEIERVSEGQRYTNKLLSEVKALPAPNQLEQWPLKARAEEKVK